MPKKALETGQRFVEIDGSTVVTFEIVGIFPAGVMEERTRRRNGQWKCRQGTWHDRKEVCECQPVVGQVQYRVPEAGIEFVADKRVQDRVRAGQGAC